LPYSKAWISTGAQFSKALAHREREARGNRPSSAELENQPERVLDLAGRIDALNQASLAREEQESEVSADETAANRDRGDVNASPVGVCDCDLQYGIHVSAR
jgi:hypothetical protein